MKEETVSLEEIKRCVSLGIRRLKADVSLPQTKIAEIIRLCENLVQMLEEYF